MNLKKIRQQKAFTMIEIIVVIFIVSIGILGVMALVVQNVKSQSYNKDNLIASQLAQEGIEMIRMVRDTNWKNNVAFNTNLYPDLGVSPAYYFMDYTDNKPRSYTGNPAQLILEKDSKGFYHDYDYNGGVETPFSRIIIISGSPLVGHYLKVICTVTWKNRNQPRSYSLETMLYDWK